MDMIDVSRSYVTQLNSQAPTLVLDCLRTKNYRGVLEYLTQLVEKGNNYTRSVNAINTYFEKMYSDLKAFSNSFHMIANGNETSLRVFPIITDLDTAISILSKLEGVTFAEICNLNKIYTIMYDKKIVQQIKLNHNRLIGSQSL
jgi:hypothetical protein